jgi:hypothetical protein
VKNEVRSKSLRGRPGPPGAAGERRRRFTWTILTARRRVRLGAHEGALAGGEGTPLRQRRLGKVNATADAAWSCHRLPVAPRLAPAGAARSRRGRSRHWPCCPTGTWPRQIRLKGGTKPRKRAYSTLCGHGAPIGAVGAFAYGDLRLVAQAHPWPVAPNLDPSHVVHWGGGQGRPGRPGAGRLTHRAEDLGVPRRVGKSRAECFLPQEKPDAAQPLEVEP